MTKTNIDIQGAYTAGQNKPYLFEDNDFAPAVNCKAIDIEDSRAYAVPVYKMSDDWFVQGLTEAPKGKTDNKSPIDYLVQAVDELYRPTEQAYCFNGTTEPYYSPIKIKNSETLHVVAGSLFDALTINTVFDSDSVILSPILKDFRIPKKLQSKTKKIVLWVNSHTNELVQTDRIEACKEIAELYGNLCSVKICIAKRPDRDQIEVSWFQDRQNVRGSEAGAKRERSSKGRYSSSPAYLIYPGKEIVRIDHEGKRVATGIMDALFVDRIYQKEPEYTKEQTTVSGNILPSKINKNTLQCAYTIGYRTASGATVLLPVGASILTETPKHIIENSRVVPDSLSLLANAGVPISIDNLPEVRRLILSSNHSHRGCGSGQNKPFPARADRSFTKDNLQLAEFY